MKYIVDDFFTPLKQMPEVGGITFISERKAK